MNSIIFSINSRNVTIEREHITIFELQRGGGVGMNDRNNKIREYIIYALINRHIPEEWYENEKWLNIKSQLFIYLNTYFPAEIYHCNLMAGRTSNYDFNINGNYIEYKFNAISVQSLPQILSLLSKDIPIGINYAEYFYNNFVPQISELYQIQPPSKEDYMNNIYQINYDKLLWFRHLYDNENQHKQEKKQIVDRSINDYLILIRESIDFRRISQLLHHQNRKHFMLYHNGTFHYDRISEEECNVTSLNCLKSGRGITGYNTIVLNTQREGTTMHLLLRWKNRAGILMPAWQIKIIRG